MPRTSPLALIAAAAALLAPAVAAAYPSGSVGGAHRRGVIFPSVEMQPGFAEASLGEMQMMANEERLLVSYEYADMLAFARCVARFDPEAATRVMNEPIGALAEADRLARLAEVNRACLVRQSKVHPLLLRAALAEAAMEQGEVRTPMANAVGVPPVAKGIRLGAISLCQNSTAPKLVSAVLATEPGSVEERAAVEKLYSASTGCGPTRLGGISPTVARLSLIDTRYKLARR